jgi:hypothetical protein
MSLTIDQILRAAQLLEQQQQMQSLLDPMAFCKLGRKSIENITNLHCWNFQKTTKIA